MKQPLIVSKFRLILALALMGGALLFASAPPQATAQDGTPPPTAFLPSRTPSSTPSPLETESSDPLSPSDATPIPPARIEFTSAPSVTPLPQGTVAASPSPTPEPVRGPLLAQETALTAINIENIALGSPLGIGEFRFNLPNNWTSDGQNILYLNLEYFETLSQQAQEAGDTIVSNLDVYLDGVLISNLSFDSSAVGNPQTYPVLLPTSVLQAQPLGNHVIRLAFRAQNHCNLNAEARILARSDLSFLHLEYYENAPALDLSFYPNIIYQGNIGLGRQRIVVAIPNDPDFQTLQTLATLVGGLGALSFNDINLIFRYVDDLQPEDWHNDNVITLGLPEQNALIAQLYADGLLQTTRNAQGQLLYDGQAIAEDDGIVEVIHNPHNPLRGMTIVTSATHEGLEKAALYLTLRPNALTTTDSKVIVSAVRPLENTPEGFLQDTQITFEQLGTEQLVLNGISRMRGSITFSIPYNEIVTDDAYVNLRYRYSSLLSEIGAVLSVEMNSESPLATLPLERETAASLQDLRVGLSSRNVTPGFANNLNINLNITSNWGCNPPDESLTWFVVDGTSSLYLPRREIPPIFRPLLLSEFPQPFNSNPDLSNLLISIPDEPSLQDLEQVYDLISLIAFSTPGGGNFRPMVIKGNNFPPSLDLANYQIIVLGMPSTNSLFVGLNEHLPQPFRPNSDRLQQIISEVDYALPDNYELGMLQIFPSPWNGDQRVLAITGVNHAGIDSALSVFIDASIWRGQLNGDIVFVSGSIATTVNTRAPLWEGQQEDEITGLATAIVLEGSATLTPDIAATVTPGPTSTFTPTFTPIPPEQLTPIFTFTPAPITHTPFPTFVPISAEQLERVTLEAPSWINILLIITLGITGLAVLFGIVTTIRSRRRER